MSMGKCRACGAPIMWIKTQTGKAMPCDAKVKWYIASPKGSQKVVLITGEVVTGEFTDDPKTATGIGYISHFATCPKASAFRRGASHRDG